MRSIILFVTTLAVSLAAPDASPALLGPADTPEVAQAKAAHLAQHAFESARNTLGYSYGAGIAYTPFSYLRLVPYGGAPIGHDGRVIDTPEVALAKIQHFAAHMQEAAKSAGHPYGALAYAAVPSYAFGYPHTAPIGPDGNVIDTPEVAHAKAEHFRAHFEEKQKQHL